MSQVATIHQVDKNLSYRLQDAMKKLLGVILCLTFFSFIPKSQSCDLCSIHNSTRMMGTNPKGFHIGMDEQFTHFGTIKQDGTTVPNTLGQYMDSSITQIFGVYNFNKKIGVQLTLPIIYRAYKRSEAGIATTGKSAGIGDIALTAHVMPFQTYSENFGFSWHISGGIKTPTGSASRLSEELAEEEEDEAVIASGIHGHDLTVGSGSVDGFIATNCMLRWKRFFFSGNLDYAIRTKGAIGYRFANDLHFKAGPGAYVALKDKFSVSAQLSVAGEHKGLDDLNGTKAIDTGITSIYLSPDVLLTWKKKLSIRLGADIPVSIQNTDFQVVPDYKIHSNFTISFR